MEFPNIGKHCSFAICNKLDFLPVVCDACSQVFCHEHMKYSGHNCSQANARDVQVPVCPLCNKPVPSKRGEPLDIAVSAHIDRDCQSDPAIGRRKIFTHKCFVKGCKKKEMIQCICPSCHNNFCIPHRNPLAHDCVPRTERPRPPNPPSNNSSRYESIQGTMGEDEALAQALALSMEENLQQHIRYQQVPVNQASSTHRSSDSNCLIS